MRITETIKWIGICTTNFDETTSFFQNTMKFKLMDKGVPIVDKQFAKYCVFNVSADQMIEILEPHLEVKDRFNGPILSFTVENLKEACLEMQEKVKFITPEITDEVNWVWRYFQAPDNNIYQIQQRI